MDAFQSTLLTWKPEVQALFDDSTSDFKARTCIAFDMTHKIFVNMLSSFHFKKVWTYFLVDNPTCSLKVAEL